MRDYASYFIHTQSIHKRRVSVKRDIDWWMEYGVKKMAKLLFIALLVLLFFVIKSFWQVSKSVANFPVDRIVLSGDAIITQQRDIQQALNEFQDSSFFNLDINSVAANIEAFSWVESAKVTRQWPNVLVIDLVEHEAVYRWGEEELLDAAGNRFVNVDSQRFAHLPQLDGIDGHESEMIFAYQQLTTALGSRLSKLGVERFVLNRYLSWELHLQSGLVIKFGRDDYQKRLKRFVAALQSDKLPDFAQLDSVDLRYQHGFSVRWKPEFLPQEQQTPMVKVSHSKTI